MMIFCVIIKYFIIFPSFTSGIGSVHEDIIKWWIKISEQKPLKCNVDTQYLKPVHDVEANLMKDYKNAKVPAIVVRPCEQKDTNYLEHIFKGSNKNGQFEGTGRLKISNKNINVYPEGELQSENKTCIIKNDLDGNMIIEAVGTYKNGMLHGPAKIVFQDSSTMITSFVNGIPIGTVALNSDLKFNLKATNHFLKLNVHMHMQYIYTKPPIFAHIGSAKYTAKIKAFVT